MASAAFALHALANAFLADFADVARLYYLMLVDSGESLGGTNSAVFVVLVPACVVAVRILAVPIAFFLDSRPHPERFARLGCAVSALVWTIFAASQSYLALGAFAFVAAELGVTLWTCALDATRVKYFVVPKEVAALQIAQITAFWAGTALALLLGGFAGENSNNNPFSVFTASAVAAWVCSATIPGWGSLPPEPPPSPSPSVKSAFETAIQVLREVWPWFVLSSAAQAMPGSSDAVVYFLVRARGFTPLGVGAVGATACFMCAASTALMERCASQRSAALAWCLVGCAAAVGLTTLASTSEFSERIPTFVKALSACVGASTQAALCAPMYGAVAKELARRGERRSSVNALVQVASMLAGFLGTALTLGLCSLFKISGGTLRGVEPLFEVQATLAPLVMLGLPDDV